MGNEQIEIILSEILQEQKEHNFVIHEQQQLLSSLKNTLEKTNPDLTDRQPGSGENNIEWKEAIETSTGRLERLIASMQRPVVQQKRILLFPEQDAAEYYRIVLGKLLFWMLMFLIATFLFLLGRQQLENQRYLHLRQLELGMELSQTDTTVKITKDKNK